MSTTKTGMSASRAIVSAFGIWASGDATAARAGSVAGEAVDARLVELSASMWRRIRAPASYSLRRVRSVAHPGLRERALPRLSAGVARTDGGRRLLGVARHHARA